MEMPEDTLLVGYADDIAAVMVVRDLERRLNQVMRRTSSWMAEHGLSLATEKTGLVLLTRRRIATDTLFQVGTELIYPKTAVKYLGLRLDNKLTFWEQIRHVSEKATRVTQALSRLMANVGGPSADKRRLLMSVTNEIMLYGCEIWADSLKKENRRKQMGAVQRRGALRIASSYRTVSEPAILVIAGVIPIDLMAQERKMAYDTKDELGIIEAKCAAREHILQCWQERWETETRGRWTAKLIRNLAEWLDRKHGEVNYYITQALTGHGYFCKYLFTMGKVDDPSCIYCDAAIDDAEHTFFGCDRWRIERHDLESKLGILNLTPANMMQAMLTSRSSWEMVANYIEKTLRMKKSEMDRHFQSGGQTG